MLSHYEVEIKLTRVDTKRPYEAHPLTPEQQKYSDVFGWTKMLEHYGLNGREVVSKVEVAQASMKADRVADLKDKVVNLIESYEPTPTTTGNYPMPITTVSIYDDALAGRLPISSVHMTLSEAQREGLLDGKGEQVKGEPDPHTMGDDGRHEQPGLEPVGYMSGADRENDELANASDLPTTRKRPAAKKAPAKKTAARRTR